MKKKVAVIVSAIHLALCMTPLLTAVMSIYLSSFMSVIIPTAISVTWWGTELTVFLCPISVLFS